MKRSIKLALALALSGSVACAGNTSSSAVSPEVTKADPLKADTSEQAVFLDFTFSGELISSRSWDPAAQIESQLLYTVGQLNGFHSVGRLDSLRLSNVEVNELGDGRVHITYDAVMPVAWGERLRIPESFEFLLPRDVSAAGQAAFMEKYSHTCIDWSAHDVTPGIYWYYYRPDYSACALDDEDIAAFTADVGPSPIQTTGKFPEYDLVWQDDALRVVAVFGKYEDGARDNGDAGIAAYNRFVEEMSRDLRRYEGTSVPEDLPRDPGVSIPEVTLEATRDDGRTITIVAILVDNVRTAGRSFDDRYAELSRDADLIVYNGHSGLGANIRALARKGDWQTGQYTIVFMNGCDTYAYVDDALWSAHAEINPDDDWGTKYVDIVMNAMPSSFYDNAHATMALVLGLEAVEEPRTYENIFGYVASSQIVLVSGEQDNTFVPGGGRGADEPLTAWAGMNEGGFVSRNEEIRFETPVLEAGRYRIEMTGSGDADLYVRVGTAPDLHVHDCRPYKASSNEACDVELPGAAPIHVMVRGDSDAEYRLSGSRL